MKKDDIIKFRIKLKARNWTENLGHDEYITIYPTIQSLIQFPIDINIWEVLSIDRFSGSTDKHKEDLYENDSVYMNSKKYGKHECIIKFKNCGFYLEGNKSIFNDNILGVSEKIERENK